MNATQLRKGRAITLDGEHFVFSDTDTWEEHRIDTRTGEFIERVQ